MKLLKRTRRVKGFKIHLPHIKCPCGRVLHIYLKNPAITFEVVKEVSSALEMRKIVGGDKEGGSSEAEEDHETR